MTVAGWCFEPFLCVHPTWGVDPIYRYESTRDIWPIFLGRSTPQLGWLRAFKNEQNLETPQITSATWASIPAVDLAVNHATQVRLSNEDIWLVRSLENQQPIKTCKFPGEKNIAGFFDHLTLNPYLLLGPGLARHFAVCVPIQKGSCLTLFALKPQGFDTRRHHCFSGSIGQDDRAHEFWNGKCKIHDI